jgi:hypothetical protein
MFQKLIVRLLLILTVGALVLPGQGITELHSIPSLISHFNEHKQHSTKSFSFVDFLEMHYNESSKHKQEENHDDLPLFHHCNVTPVFIAEQVLSIHFCSIVYFPVHSTEVTCFYEFKTHQPVFQPPRLV